MCINIYVFILFIFTHMYVYLCINIYMHVAYVFKYVCMNALRSKYIFA